MKVLVNMTTQHAGRYSGVSQATFNLLRHLLENTDHHYILRSAWSENDVPGWLLHERLTFLTIRRPPFIIFDYFRQSLAMSRLCSSLGVDVILNADPFGTPAGAKKIVTIVHDLYFRTIPGSVPLRERWTTDFIYRGIIRGSDHIVCISNSTLDDLVKYYPSAGSKSLTIYSDSSLGDAAPSEAAPVPIEGRYLLAVGNATSNKNFSVLGQAFAALRDTYPDLRIVHVGQDADGQIAKAAGDTNDHLVVRRTGVSPSELTSLYRGAVCLVAPSLYEGFCLPIIEAQETSCPVICSNIAATAEVAGDAAILFSPRNVPELITAIDRVLKEPELASDLRMRGHRNRARFSWKASARRYAALLFDQRAESAAESS